MSLEEKTHAFLSATQKDIVSAFSEKEIEVPSNIRLSQIPEYINQIELKKPFSATIEVTCTNKRASGILRAYLRLRGSSTNLQTISEVSETVATFIVTEPNTYTVYMVQGSYNGTSSPIDVTEEDAGKTLTGTVRLAVNSAG